MVYDGGEGRRDENKTALLEKAHSKTNKSKVNVVVGLVIFPVMVSWFCPQVRCQIFFKFIDLFFL